MAVRLIDARVIQNNDTYTCPSSDGSEVYQNRFVVFAWFYDGVPSSNLQPWSWGENALDDGAFDLSSGSALSDRVGYTNESGILSSNGGNVRFAISGMSAARVLCLAFAGVDQSSPFGEAFEVDNDNYNISGEEFNGGMTLILMSRDDTTNTSPDWTSNNGKTPDEAIFQIVGNDVAMAVVCESNGDRNTTYTYDGHTNQWAVAARNLIPADYTPSAPATVIIVCS